jgi:hypothetical protein
MPYFSQLGTLTKNTARRRVRAKRNVFTAAVFPMFDSGHSVVAEGFFPPAVMINCTLLSGLVLAPILFPCNSAANLLLYRKSS